MAKQHIIIKDFTGGIGTAGEKKDVQNSVRFMKHLNPFEDTSYVTQSRKTTKISGSTVDGLLHWFEDGSPWSTSRYGYDSGGKIYQETSGGVWSSLRTVSGGAGEGLKVFNDYLYYALGVSLGRYGKLSGTPAFDDDFLSDGTTNIDQSATGTGATDYTTPTSISETATNKNTITPQKDPIKDIVINVDVVGTGDWTLTLHDSNDVEIGSKTIANGSMSTGDITFTFDTPLRVIIGNQYHFHVTSTVADGGVDTGTNNDLEASYFVEHYGILNDATFHPMEEFLNFLVIGNGRYIAKWDEALYNPNFITLAAGYEVRSFAKFNEFIVAAAYKGSTIQEAEEARLYFWDGIETTFNFFTDVRIGVPNAIINHEGNLIGVYGNDGSIYEGNEPFVSIVDSMPQLTRGKYLEVYPGAVSNYQGRTLFGISALTDDGTTLEQGVYEYGGEQSQLPQGFNYPFTISTGTTTATTLKIGCVKTIGTDIYIGWRDDSTYGVDKIALDDGANSTATLETLIFDNSDVEHQMLALTIEIEFEELTTGQTVTPKWRFNRASSWTTGTAATSGATSLNEAIYTRCNEIEFGFDLASSSNTFIKVTQVKFTYDDLSGEN